jgi:hypothetical protein
MKMIWVLIFHITGMMMVAGPKPEERDVSALMGYHVFLRQDACEAAKDDLIFDYLQAGRRVPDLECRSMGVVE